MIIAATGHRPQDYIEAEGVIVLKARVKMQDKATKLICGMAAGFDLLAGLAAMELEIPIIAVRPWSTHGVPKEWRERYAAVLGYADEVWVTVMADAYPGPQAYQLRNEQMVDAADAVMAYWNPEKTHGGTYNCIQYALAQEVPAANIWFDPPF